MELAVLFLIAVVALAVITPLVRRGPRLLWVFGVMAVGLLSGNAAGLVAAAALAALLFYRWRQDRGGKGPRRPPQEN